MHRAIPNHELKAKEIGNLRRLVVDAQQLPQAEANQVNQVNQAGQVNPVSQVSQVSQVQVEDDEGNQFYEF
jgi:hypothetical protein|tara:strand:+ start:437 stop:649 length:213 start_codon:yes stop_codon:yes gene_type:complete